MPQQCREGELPVEYHSAPPAELFPGLSLKYVPHLMALGTALDYEREGHPHHCALARFADDVT